MYRLKIHLHGAELQELTLESGREYTFGRGENCDVRLAEGKGVSRVHFRVLEDGGNWTAQVVSKFGSISQGGREQMHLALDVGMVFKLGPYDFSFLELAQPQQEQHAESMPASTTLPVAVGQSSSGYSSHESPQRMQLVSNPPETETEDFDGNDEATRVASSQPELPFLRITESGGRSEEIQLDGKRWVAGREDGCQILLNDRKSSRRQFEISSTPQGYFIRDLGSSNGTLLNRVALAHDELKAIRSGDVIQVGAAVLHFEVRDPHFNTKLMVVPQENRSDYGIVVQRPYEMINYPMVQGPGGAVRVDGGNGWLQRVNSGGLPFSDLADKKKKKLRFYLLAAIVLIPLILVLSLTGNDKKPKTVATSRGNPEFDKLSPQQQQQVKETFLLAKNLYMQQKLALAGDQLERLHKILPTGYENSLMMAQDCMAQKQLEIELANMEREKRRQEEIRRTVETTVRNCEALSRRTLSLDEINNCLRPALEFDPENSLVRELISRVQTRIDQDSIAKRNQDDYRRRVAKGVFLYNTAFKLEEQGEYLEALDAYRKHAESPYPDPDGLKKLSHQQIFGISKRLSAKVEDTLRAAEASYAVGNFKEALENCARAIKMDPRNARAHELNGRYRNELKTKLREIYEESIISEGLGQIDEAKSRWTKIVGMDTADGEYYKKAKNKLHTYGAFGN